MTKEPVSGLFQSSPGGTKTRLLIGTFRSLGPAPPRANRTTLALPPEALGVPVRLDGGVRRESDDHDHGNHEECEGEEDEPRPILKRERTDSIRGECCDE